MEARGQRPLPQTDSFTTGIDLTSALYKQCHYQLQRKEAIWHRQIGIGGSVPVIRYTNSFSNINS